MCYSKRIIQEADVQPTINWAALDSAIDMMRFAYFMSGLSSGVALCMLGLLVYKLFTTKKGG